MYTASHYNALDQIEVWLYQCDCIIHSLAERQAVRVRAAAAAIVSSFTIIQLSFRWAWFIFISDGMQRLLPLPLLLLLSFISFSVFSSPFHFVSFHYFISLHWFRASIWSSLLLLPFCESCIFCHWIFPFRCNLMIATFFPSSPNPNCVWMYIRRACMRVQTKRTR